MATAITIGADILPTFMAGEASLPVLELAPEQIDYSEALSGIAGRLETLAAEQVRMKGPTEERWLKDVRAFHGYYSSSIEGTLKAENTSRAYVKLTRAKTVALEARLFDLIFPTDDRNWGIQATPVPKLSKEAQEALKNAKEAHIEANKAEEMGDPARAQAIVAEGNDQADRAEVAQKALDAVIKAAGEMQEEMDDQLVESRYPAQSREMIRDGCMLGTGILKGPVVNENSRGRWISQEGAGHVLEQSQDPRPRVRRVDPWSFFPDMSARTIDEAEFTFERYLWTRKDLRKMVESHGFDPDAVRELLRDDRKARPVTATGLNYLVQLRSITGEGEANIRGRYVGWEYHGPLECDEVCTILRAQGQLDLAAEYELKNDPLQDHRVVLYICEGVILKIAPEYPLDSGETLYSIFNIEKAEGSIFGYGIPHIMSDSQFALNSAWRMGLDNAALSVGPQAVIDKTAIEPADGSWTMLPKKVWHRIKAAVPGTQPPVEFFNVPNNMGEIEKIIQIAMQFIDMETGIPMPQQGDQTQDQTKTVGGMTILQNAANIIFRRIVKNYDDGVIAPTMRRLYDWNMQFNDRVEIKGDMQIDARGTAVLLLKEIQAQNLMFVVTQLMAHPGVQPMLKPYQNVLKLFQSMMIPTKEVMVSEEEYEANMAKLAQQPPAPDAAQINAESRIAAAKINAESRESANQTQLRVAEMRENTAMLDLAQSQGLSLEEIRADLAKLDKQLESKERIKAVEIATEDERAREAKAAGRDEVEAVGQGIG